MILGILNFDRLPVEIVQTDIFPYLGYEDLSKLRKVKSRRLKEIVDGYIPCKLKKFYS